MVKVIVKVIISAAKVRFFILSHKKMLEKITF